MINIKYLLNSGKIVNATDTDWLRQNEIWESKNKALLPKSKTEFKKQEKMRLLYLDWYKKTHNIVDVLYE